MAQTKRIKADGVHKREIDTEMIGLVYWLQTKKRVKRMRRANEAKFREKRRTQAGRQETEK